MNALVPTLPTPTTLRAMSTTSNRSSKWRRSSCKVARYASELFVDDALHLFKRKTAGPAKSRIGMTIGGWLTIRY